MFSAEHGGFSTSLFTADIYISARTHTDAHTHIFHPLVWEKLHEKHSSGLEHHLADLQVFKVFAKHAISAQGKSKCESGGERRMRMLEEC